MLDQKRIDEINNRVAEADLLHEFNKDTTREYFRIVNAFYEEVNAVVGNPHSRHPHEADHLFMKLEARRVELAAELGEEIEQEA